MTRLTTWFDELAPHLFIEEILGSPAVQRAISVGMWIVAPVDYTTAVSLSYLLRPINKKNNCLS